MFFSSDMLMTKNLILNTKCPLKFLLLFHFKKRRGQPCLFSFQNETITKASADIWCLLLGFWSSVCPMRRTLEEELKDRPRKGIFIGHSFNSMIGTN